MHWNTQKIIETLKKELPVEVDISINGPGGDVDTNSIHVHPKGKSYWISITGFTTNGYLEDDRDNCIIDMVEIRDRDSDSCGGIGARILEHKILAAHVQQIMEDLQFDCVPCLGNYF